jgi:choline kinase
MRAVIIGAGRGSRLGPNTANVPKTLVPVLGRPMLDHVLEALAAGGFARKDIVFICGYAEDVVRARYPEFTYVQNTGWESNNVLLSLMTARDYLKDGFVSTYADIVYEGAVVEKLLASGHALTLGCDVSWRRRYVGRTQHPESDAEKLVAEGSQVTRVSRQIPSELATGEFIGVMRATAQGAGRLLGAFDRARGTYSGRVFREGRTFEKAYLIDLLQEMLEGGEVMHRVDTHGGYMELDTEQDLASAERWWNER